MKTTKQQSKEKQAVRSAGRAYKAGLTNCLNEPIPHLSRRDVRELTQFFSEDSLIRDCEFDVMFNQKYF
jgi:hypothetical protein